MADYHPIVKAVIASAPYFQIAIPTDSSITIADTDQIAGYFPGKKIDLKLKEGMKLIEGSPAVKVIKEGTILRMVVPASLHGIEFTANLIPLKDISGKVVGVVSLGIQHQNEKELKEISSNVFEALDSVNQNAGHVSLGAHSLVSLTKELHESALAANEEMKKTEDVLNFIRKVANQTNLLGLNAAIEATHAKEYGRGFGIVAKEIRNLSQNTRSSAETIQETLENMKKSMEKITSSIEEIAKVGEVQKVTTEGIHTSIEALHEMSIRLNEYADLI